MQRVSEERARAFAARGRERLGNTYEWRIPMDGIDFAVAFSEAEVAECRAALAASEVRAAVEGVAYEMACTRADKKAVADEPLAKFGAWCLGEMDRDGGGDIDGGAAQDKALELGVLERVTVTEPCGEDCYCAEFYGEFPAECIREAAAIRERGEK